MRHYESFCPDLNGMKSIDQLLARFNPHTGEIAGKPTTTRHLSDLRGCFYDNQAYESALQAGDPLLYTVASVEPGQGEGDLHLGVGRIMPGRVGSEYYMTKGHLHTWREAAEIYIGLSGDGMMLLEDQTSGESVIVSLRPNEMVYVPGHTAHRTINIGTAPLVYLGVYSAKAGHDYTATAQRNFRKILIDRDGKPVLMDRAQLSGSNRSVPKQKGTQ
jgi:glucose-6-phosphate isomerase